MIHLCMRYMRVIGSHVVLLQVLSIEDQGEDAPAHWDVCASECAELCVRSD